MNNLNQSLDDYSTQQARADEQRRRKLRRELLAQWQTLRAALDADGIAAIRGISDAEWQAAQEQIMPLDWTTLTEQMNALQRLVFFTARWGFIKEDRMRVTLLDMRRKAYEDELTIQAQHAGCPGRVGRLTNLEITGQLNEVSDRDAKSIGNTYNYFLALEILRAGEANPRGGPLYYAKAVGDWQPTYWAWKDPQITLMTDGTARTKAQQDFYIQNRGVAGTAKLEPTTAVCPICQGWIARGIVPLRVALNNPPPYHQGCPHIWSTRPDKVASEDCPLLWMGG